MNSTLVIYKNKGYVTKKFAEILGYVLGPAKTLLFEQFNENFENYSNVVIVMSVYSKDDLYQYMNFINANVSQLKNKKVVIFSTSFNIETAKDTLKKVDEILGQSVIFSQYFKAHMEISKIVNKALEVKKILKDNNDMPLDALKLKIEEFLLKYNTCTLCTTHENWVRATPIEYNYLNGSIYFISEGGEKFAHIYINPNVSIAVYENCKDFKNLAGIQISGTAKLVEKFSEEYINVMKNKGLIIENLKKMPVYLNVIKVVPKKYEILLSDLSKEGYSVKQVLELSNV
ncbi:hypothetical protein HBE96_25820 [Clostridium sp. P21]|uniref:Pyridoxamine 5'-phosphate oxidase N-terminal domain-containing protein n=1 Tax=Clostridium muellerianum TaxID=2716538 RepID=A0A7Y0HRD5_9CLOT|nr:pyridoxamine 5'-phosphate oxidase family protein [Clostridium muellerianum]NMM66000.1 hypothetical protein [Clostridium muellerianum]